MDRLGNTRYITNEAGSVVQSYLYSPFGQIHTESGSLNQPYQYVGGEFYYSDEDVGLKLLGQRWYDAEVGRFISRAPIGERGLNLYGYVRNNPVKYKDPAGTSIYGTSVCSPYDSSPLPFSCVFFTPEIGCNPANSYGSEKCGPCEIRVLEKKVWSVTWVSEVAPYLYNSPGGKVSISWKSLRPYKTKESHFNCVPLCSEVLPPSQLWSTVVSNYYEFSLPEEVSQVSAQVELEYITSFYYTCS